MTPLLFISTTRLRPRKERLTTLKRLKRSDENALERKLRLGKANKHLRLAVERQDRKARLEKMIATTQHRLALETEEERRAKNGLDLI